MTLKTAVVMPIGRVDDDFHVALDAVRRQETTFPFTIVLSMNNPDPAAAAALADAVSALGDDRIVVIDSSAHRGAAPARNAGARATDAEIIAFTDSDDEVQPGWLQAMVDGLGDAAAVSGHVSEAKFTPERQRHWRPPATPGALPTYLGVPYLLSGNLAVDRAVFDEMGGFDTSLDRCEDLALGWALVGAGHTIGYVPDAVLEYRHRAGLWPMLKQHYWYGVGMSQVMVRNGIPAIEGAASGRAALFTPNNQQVAKRTLISTMRRGSIAAGRLVGLVTERLRRRRLAIGTRDR